MNRALKKGTGLTRREKLILARLQTDIPFVENPWYHMAEELGMREGAFLKDVRSLKKKNAIRRIAATFDPRKLGFVSTLVAVKVPDEHADKVADRVSAYREVTHNYKRDAEYNLWFTLIAENRRKIARILETVKRYEGVEDVLELPAKRIFKINVKFKIGPV